MSADTNSDANIRIRAWLGGKTGAITVVLTYSVVAASWRSGSRSMKHRSFRTARTRVVLQKRIELLARQLV